MRFKFFNATACLMLSILGVLGALMPAQALVKVQDAATINTAIRYGIQNRAMGLAHLLGPNWVEGDNGTLLNIYSPFMLIASQAGRKGVEGTSPEDIKLVRKRMARILGEILAVKTPQTVKFTVALYGDTPDFGKYYKAIIEGEGRGKTVRLTPLRAIPDAIANTNPDGSLYEAINAYYFKFEDLENLDNFRLILTNPTGDEKVFSLDNHKIY